MNALTARLARNSAAQPNGCVHWTGYIKDTGYGRLGWGGRVQAAHRLAWVAANGRIPDGMCILHKCDNRRCINADHLFLGSQIENISDRERKGRGVRPTGASHGMAKLTPQQVAEIRSATGSQNAIARQFGIAQTTVGQIRRRETWAHVGDEQS